MARSRTYRRPTTLTKDVAKLKRAVARNKPELKYYDVLVSNNGEFGTGAFANPFSLFKNQASDATQVEVLGVPAFIGRRIMVHRIHTSVNLSDGEGSGSYAMYRETKIGGPTPSIEDDVQIRYDPEYQASLRDFWAPRDNDNAVNAFQWNVRFGKAGRLVQFDDVTTATATGDITNGNILCLSDNVLVYTWAFRVWYTDA